MLCTLDFSLCYAAFYDSRSKSLVCKNLMLKGVNPCFNGRYSQRFRSFKKFNLVKGLNPCFNGRYSQSRNGGWQGVLYSVLILVLMEDTLRDLWQLVQQFATLRLNPCFNGRYSQSHALKGLYVCLCSLNPCFNGRYSQRGRRSKKPIKVESLNPCFNGRYSQRQ